MSSGESELVALGCDIVSFSHRAGSQTWVNKTNMLIIDEPDVHLHPDLQCRLMSLLMNEVILTSFRVVIATHSTSIVAALSEFTGARVAFMKMGAETVEFQPISNALQGVLPIFGAHPLSNVFNANPILLVEGEDEERLWQQVVRSSNGSIKLWPCSVGGVGNLPTYEKTVNDIDGYLRLSSCLLASRPRRRAVRASRRGYHPANASELPVYQTDPFSLNLLKPLIEAGVPHQWSEINMIPVSYRATSNCVSVSPISL